MTDAVSVFEVLNAPGTCFEFVLGDLELFPNLLRLVSDHRASRLHLLVLELIPNSDLMLVPLVKLVMAETMLCAGKTAWGLKY